MTRYSGKRRLSILVTVLSVALGAPAGAQESEVVATAREVAKQGLSAYDAGQYEEALEKLSQAYGAVRIPTLALYSARAAEKLGKLVKAAELYLEATSLTPDLTWQTGQFEAQAAAKAERSELLPRIPRLVVRVEGGGEHLEVKVDEVMIPISLLKAEQLIDPGSHVILVRSGEEERSQEVWLDEGETEEVLFELPKVESRAAPAVRSQPEDAGVHDGKLQRTFGWISIGVGSAAFLTGAGIGVYLVWKQGDLVSDGNCDNAGHCYQNVSHSVSRFNTQRTLSTAGIVAGSVIAAAGVTLLLTAPKVAKNELTLRALPNGLELSGRF